MSATILLHPAAPGYCQECIYRKKGGGCTNQQYKENIYKVLLSWRYCKFKKLKSEG